MSENLKAFVTGLFAKTSVVKNKSPKTIEVGKFDVGTILVGTNPYDGYQTFYIIDSIDRRKMLISYTSLQTEYSITEKSGFAQVKPVLERKTRTWENMKFSWSEHPNSIHIYEGRKFGANLTWYDHRIQYRNDMMN